MKFGGKTNLWVLITLLELPLLCVAVISLSCDLRSRSSMRAAKRRSRAAESPSPTTTTLRRGPYVRGGSRSASASCPRSSSISTERARALGFLPLRARDRALDASSVALHVHSHVMYVRIPFWVRMCSRMRIRMRMRLHMRTQKGTRTYMRMRMYI